MRAFLTITAFLVLIPTDVGACINDVELPQHEREFRSHYESSRMTSSDPGGSSSREWSLWALKAGGITMLAVAFGVTVLRQRTES